VPSSVLLTLEDNIVGSSNCKAFGGNLGGSVAGQLSSFQVQLKDRFDNNITESVNGTTFEISFTDSSTGTVVLPSFFAPEYSQNGQYSLLYNITVSNEYNLAVLVSNTTIKGSPYGCLIVPGADPCDTFADTA
jgi:hypothetical protein